MRPIEAVETPLPTLDITPPVTKMYFIDNSKFKRQNSKLMIAQRNNGNRNDGSFLIAKINGDLVGTSVFEGLGEFNHTWLNFISLSLEYIRDGGGRHASKQSPLRVGHGLKRE